MHQISIRPTYRFIDFCREFGVGRTAAYSEINAGRLKIFKCGRLTMIAGEDALAWRERYRATDKLLAA